MRQLLLVALLGAWACSSEHGVDNNGPEDPGPVPGLDPAIHLERVKNDGTEQAGIAGKDLRLPLIVRVVNGSTPISGAFVQWETVFPGAIVDPVLAKSDLNGLAITHYHAGTASGYQSVQASYNGSTIPLLITVGPDDPRQIVALRGDGDSARVNLFLGLHAKVTDQYGNAVGNLPVSWQVLSGSATLDTSFHSTGFNGEAGQLVQFGPIPGPAEISAGVAGIGSVTFHVKSY